MRGRRERKSQGTAATGFEDLYVLSVWPQDHKFIESLNVRGQKLIKIIQFNHLILVVMVLRAGASDVADS